MAVILDARVKQKVATAEEWAGDNTILLEGEQGFLIQDSGEPINFKIGDGTKTFAELPYWIDYSQAAYIPYEASPEQEVAYTFVGEGTYGSIVVPEWEMAVLGWNGSSWSLDDTIDIPLQDISGLVPKNSVILDPETDFIPPENINLFDKDSHVIPGYVIDLTDGSITPNQNGATTEFIRIREDMPLYRLQVWEENPKGVAWYTEPSTEGFITYTTSSPGAPGGLINSNTMGAKYIRMNVWSDSGTTTLQENIDSLMVYSGIGLIEYKNYEGFFDTIGNKKVYLNPKEIESIVNDIQEKEKRERSYTEPINILDSGSLLDSNTIVTPEKVGNWTVRTDIGTSVEQLPDGGVEITGDGTSVNQGLIYYLFFQPNEIGKQVWVEFEAQSTGGSTLTYIFANSATAQTSFNLSTSMVKYLLPLTVGSDQYGDQRLMIVLRSGTGEPSSAIFKNVRVYFTEPDSDDGDNDTSYQPIYNPGAMRNFRYKTINSDTGLTVLSLIGDSWTQSVPNAINYAREVSKLLRASFGDGGGGFYDFSSSAANNFMRSADIDDADDTRSGTVTYIDQTPDAKGVNLAHGEFETGFSLALNIKTAHTGLVVHYYGGSEYGSFRYRIDGGSWNTVDTSTSNGHQTISHSVSDDVHTMDFEVISGTVIMLGVDMQRDTGVRVHKLGNRGSRAHNYPEVDRQNWINAFSSLGVDSSTILLGTNDRTVGQSPNQFEANINYLIEMIYESDNKYADIGLVCPSNNQNSAPYEMIEFGRKLLQIAKEEDLAYLDLIPLFGTPEQILEKGTFHDVVHPTIQGGNMIAKYLIDKMLK